MNYRKAILFSAPSGSGKTTIIRELLKRFDCFEFSISATSRQPREGEQDGVDYYFLSPETFAQRVEAGDFLEWEEVYAGTRYGTLKSEIDFWLKQDKAILVEVEAAGVGPLKLNIPEAVCFFVVPTSMEELERLIREKYNDDEASTRMRLNKAKLEMEIAPLFNNQITNDDPDRAYKEIKEIALREWAKLEEDE